MKGLFSGNETNLSFYVQMAAAMLWQFGNLEQAREEFVFQAQYHFEQLWHNLTKGERHALCFAAGNSGLAAPTQAMTNLLQRHGLVRADGSLFSSAFEEFVKDQR